VTGYGLANWGIMVPFPAAARFFSSPKHRSGLGDRPAPLEVIQLPI